jgi:hypothetical protein
VDDWQPSGRRDTVDVVSKRGIADQRQDPVGCGHVVSLQSPDDTSPSLRWHLWMNAKLGTKLTNR